MELKLAEPTEFDLYRDTTDGCAKFVDRRAMKEKISLDIEAAQELNAGKHRGLAVPISAGKDKGLFIFPKLYPVTRKLYENLIAQN